MSCRDGGAVNDRHETDLHEGGLRADVHADGREDVPRREKGQMTTFDKKNQAM